MKGVLATGALTVAAVLAASGCNIQDALSGKAELTGKVKEVVDRSRTTHATYSIYTSNWSPGDGAWSVNWAAEFHQGVHHRVEAAAANLVADCQAMTGSEARFDRYPARTGVAVAQEACGVNTNIPVTDFAYLGVVDTPWGPADRIRLSNDQVSRIYEVNKDGVIVGETWYRNSKGHPATLKQTVLAVVPGIPSPDMFDAASLQKSFTPDQYKAAPKP